MPEEVRQCQWSSHSHCGKKIVFRDMKMAIKKWTVTAPFEDRDWDPQ